MLRLRLFLAPCPTMIVFLGPVGTYSYEAALLAFGSSVDDTIQAKSLKEVIESVAEKRAAAGVLPVENSTNGPVYQALEALIDIGDSVEITNEVRVPIKHQLYTMETSLSNISTVFSHSQVWGQSDGWLKTNLPGVKRVDCESTGKAVEMTLNTPRTAALAGPSSTSLEALIPNCADDPYNTTRFLILRTHKTVLPTIKRSQTVYALVKDTDITTLVSQCKGKLTFLVEKPATTAWRYDFFVEVTDICALPEDWIYMGAKDV